jgi:hypothetical protein
LFDLSFRLRSPEDVVAQLETFMKWAPLRLCSYSELIDLIHAAKNGPVDALFQLLEIGGKMIEKYNFPDPKSCEFVDKIICDLHSRKEIIPCYGSNQQAARDELKRLHFLFVPPRGEPAGDNSGKWKTRDIKRVVRRQERRAATGIPPMTDDEVEEFLVRKATGRDESDTESFASAATLIDSSTNLSGSVASRADFTERKHLFNVTGPFSVFEQNSPSRPFSNEEEDVDESRDARLEVEVLGSCDWPDQLEERASQGLEKFRKMDERQKEEVHLLAALFTKWGDAYDSSKTVWEKMKTDHEFDIDVLISQIQFAFANFLVGAIRQFMLDEA